MRVSLDCPTCPGIDGFMLTIPIPSIGGLRSWCPLENYWLKTQCVGLGVQTKAGPQGEKQFEGLRLLGCGDGTLRIKRVAMTFILAQVSITTQHTKWFHSQLSSLRRSL
jgi:hypothetical protein